MPFVDNTPESLLRRADSKNPNSTCRGITTSGSPCRRPLGSSSKRPAPPGENSYCWQHKSQAGSSSSSQLPTPRVTGPRSSLDTLTERLGLVALNEKHERRNAHSKRKHTKPAKKTKTSLSLCFCSEITVESDPPARPALVRPQPRPVQHAIPNKTKLSPYVSDASPSKSSHRSSVSQTARLKDLIPDDLDAAAASVLLAELAKPYDRSEKPGYIYMYWLTASGATQAGGRSGNVPADAARAMLAPPPPRSRPTRPRRPSDVVTSYADAGKTMVLKIGRSDNVQRRMNEWQRQCGRDVTVLRTYPYIPSRGLDPFAAAAPRRTPHANRVEQLIKLELKGRGMKADMGKCTTCGREHREWFEVDASTSAVRLVDGVIRRWVEWDEAMA